MKNKKKQFWQKVLGGLFTFVVLPLLVLVVWSKREKVYRNRDAMERYVTGDSAEILTIEIFLCRDLLEEKLCPTSIKNFARDKIYELSNEPLRKSLDAFYAKIATYNRLCSSLNKTQQEKEILFFYSESQRIRVGITAMAMMEKNYYEIVGECRKKIREKYPSVITTGDK